MWVADRVDEALEEYREAHGIAGPWETRERVVVAITGAPGRRRRDPARRAHGRCARAASCSACTSVRPTGLRGPSTERARRAARGCSTELGGEYHEVAGADVAAALVRFARAENATQLVLGASRQSRWTQLAPRLGDQRRAPRVGRHRRARDLVRRSATTAPRRGRASPAAAPAARRCRRVGGSLGWVLAVARARRCSRSCSANVRDGARRCRATCCSSCCSSWSSPRVGGFVPAFVAAVAGFLLANWYFTPPLLHVHDRRGREPARARRLPRWSAAW